MGETFDLKQMKSSKIINGQVINENITYSGNKRMGCYFVDDTLSLPLIKSINKKIITLSNDLKPFNSIQYTTIPKYSFNRYGEGDFLEWHEDRHEIINGATITFIIQLNDNYGDGFVKYMLDGIEYNVPKILGSVFIFDSNITHSVEKISSGNRYSLNVWPASTKKISLI
jgi:predicted 2-oxoglutarate/Fe(II)-dependent dioxygenase YbiX